MSKGADVLNYLIPTGGWVIYGDNLQSVIYDDGVEPVTKKQFDDAYKIIDQVKKAQAETKATAKAALLERLGITQDEANLLLS